MAHAKCSDVIGRLDAVLHLESKRLADPVGTERQMRVHIAQDGRIATLTSPAVDPHASDPEMS